MEEIPPLFDDKRKRRATKNKDLLARPLTSSTNYNFGVIESCLCGSDAKRIDSETRLRAQNFKNFLCKL